MGEKSQIRTWHDHRGAVAAECGNAAVIDCDRCGFKHLIPLPSDADLAVFYDKGFYTDLWPEYIQRQYEDREWYEIQYAEVYGHLDRLLPRGLPRNVLDIGSGPGLFLAAGVRRGWRAVGVEGSPHACRFARDVLGLQDVHNAMFGEGNHAAFGVFSVVHMRNLLEHVPDPARVLGEAGSILEPHGTDRDHRP